MRLLVAVLSLIVVSACGSQRAADLPPETATCYADPKENLLRCSYYRSGTEFNVPWELAKGYVCKDPKDDRLDLLYRERTRR